MADALGVSNTLVRLPKRGLMTKYWPMAAALADYETKLHQWILPLIEILPDDVKVSFDGLAGDIPSNAVRRDSAFIHLEEFRLAMSDDAETLAGKILGRPLTFRVLGNALRRNLSSEDAVSRVAAELRKYDRTPNQLTYFYLMNRTRRAISQFSLKLMILKCETLFPYLDNDLCDFIMSIPPEMKITHNLREDVTTRAYPEVRSIPLAVFEGQRARTTKWQRQRHYPPQRRTYFLQSMWRLYVKRNWMFDNVRAGPRLVHDLLMLYMRTGHVSYVFNESFLTFYQWLARYFPEGVK